MDMKEINQIRSQIGQLDSKMADAKARLEAAGLRALGLELGSRIICEERNKEQLAEVTGCEASYGTPRPKAVKVKKDGTTSSVSAGYIGKWRKA